MIDISLQRPFNSAFLGSACVPLQAAGPPLITFVPSLGSSIVIRMEILRLALDVEPHPDRGLGPGDLALHVDLLPHCIIARQTLNLKQHDRIYPRLTDGALTLSSPLLSVVLSCPLFGLVEHHARFSLAQGFLCSHTRPGGRRRE